MDGTVELESQYGKGSTFKVILPFVIVKEENLSKPETVRLHTNGQLHFSGSNVLIAEDNKVNQLLISSLLQQYNIWLKIVENGEQVIEAVSNEKFDLILMDLQMPVMDGYTATHIVREKLYVNTPIVAMTAFVLPGENEKCYAAGMNDYLSKPIDTAQLEQLLKKYLGIKKANLSANTNEQVDFILDLSGGDKGMATRILSQVREEVPSVIEKLTSLQNTNDADAIKRMLHSMVSTFSPLGGNSTIMQVITDCRKRLEGKAPDYFIILQDCINSLDGVSAEITDSINGLKQ
jgi:CheY-like chemotaxis protein